MSTTMRPVWLAGRGLSCPLGASLAESLARLTQPALRTLVDCGDLGTLPLFSLSNNTAQDAEQWHLQTRVQIRQVAAEAGLTNKPDAPLFIASSSINIGALELGSRWQRDSAFAELEELAKALDWQGPLYWINTACTSALNAVLAARSLIANGLHDDVMVLGLELPNRFTTRGFAAMQLLSPTRPQPLGAARDGLVLGEAIAALHLSSAPARWQIGPGAHIVDGADSTGASVDAIVRCWQDALGTPVESVDLIKLQASGSPMNDQKEVDAVTRLGLKPTPELTSLKALLGHSLGASGAAELALLSACLEAGTCSAPDYPLDTTLPLTLTTAPAASVRRALLSIIGFGGSHAAVRLEDADVTTPSPPIPTRTYKVIGRQTDAQSADWQNELYTMLGSRPRRLGSWVELGLWGALRCMRQAGVPEPGDDLIIRISSLDGPRQAIEKALSESLDSGTPMPFSFLQSQPSQLLARLAAALHWQGDARIVTQRDPIALIRLALCEQATCGGDILLGWLDEATPTLPARSQWLFLRSDAAALTSEAPAGIDGDVMLAHAFRLDEGVLRWW
ncbi:beta-ketoacyl synthase N-terminal-like domain-containing protein [Viridibacterium curvum]|uniref:Ketosynthase family 3 (KS3) domain-containing protein n=1 Tax=Viridibacterium curvum TaxID=1101404 RepID=A0ABP9R1Q2_9RHOO